MNKLPKINSQLDSCFDECINITNILTNLSSMTKQLKNKIINSMNLIKNEIDINPDPNINLNSLDFNQVLSDTDQILSHQNLKQESNINYHIKYKFENNEINRKRSVELSIDEGNKINSRNQIDDISLNIIGNYPINNNNYYKSDIKNIYRQEQLNNKINAKNLNKSQTIQNQNKKYKNNTSKEIKFSNQRQNSIDTISKNRHKFNELEFNTSQVSNNKDYNNSILSNKLDTSLEKSNNEKSNNNKSQIALSQDKYNNSVISYNEPKNTNAILPVNNTNPLQSYLQRIILNKIKQKDNPTKDLEGHEIQNEENINVDILKTQDIFRQLILNKIRPKPESRRSSKLSNLNSKELEKDELKKTSGGEVVPSYNLVKTSVLGENDVTNFNKADTIANLRTNSEIIKEFEVNNTRFKQLIFEMNNQPKSLIMVDTNFQIMFQNTNICHSLFQDKGELLHTELAKIVVDSDSEEQKAKMNEIMEAMHDDDMKSEDFGMVSWTFKDKNENKVVQNCRFKLQQFEDETNAIFNNLIIYMDSDVDTDNFFVVDPRHPIYLLFMLIIALSLFVLIFYVPQDVAFGTVQMAIVNFWIDMAITAVFTLDIILNFFVAIEDKENSKFIYDNSIIASTYFKNAFLMDLIATVPFDQIFNFVTINLSLIKTVRIFKVLKLVKLLRISKQFTVVSNKSYLLDSEVGKEIYQMFKRNSGQFELMVQNSFILIASHQQTILHFQIKDVMIEDADHTWIWNYQPSLEGLPLWNIQIFLMCENVKTAMGLAVLAPTNPVEIAMNLMWMFIGLSLFGQGIGNISSQLNNIQAEDLEMLNAITFFQDLCENNDVDPRVTQMIMRDIEEYQASYQDRKFYKKGKILSSQVMIQLETALYKDFIDRFSLFDKLNITTIRYIKNNARVQHGKLKQGQGSVINEVILITKGKLTLYDSQMKLINEYGPNEIQGMHYFTKQCKLKYKIDLDLQYESNLKSKREYEVSKNMQDYIDFMNHMKKEIRDKLATGNPTTKTETAGNTDENQEPKLVQEDTIKLAIQNTPVSSSDLEYIAIPFNVIEEVFLIDTETFFVIWKYNAIQFETISDEHRVKSEKMQKDFNRDPLPGLLITPKEEVHDLNIAIQEQQLDLSFISGLCIRDFLTEDHVMDNQEDNLQADADLMQIIIKTIEGKKVKLKIEKSEQLTLTRGQVNLDDNIDGDIQQFNLKKSMVDVRAIQVSIEVLEEK